MVVKAPRAGKWAAGKPIVDGYIAHDQDGRRPQRLPHSGRVFPQYLYFVTNKDENDKKGDNFDIYVTYREGRPRSSPRPRP